MSARIKDVADAANVSTSTVVRVLHNRPYVRDEVRKRVFNEIERLGYIPNKIASLLKTGVKKTIGLICSEYPSTFWDEIVNGAVTAAEELNLAGVVLTVARVNKSCSAAEYRDQIYDLYKTGIDFLIITGIFPDQAVDVISKYDIPVGVISIDMPLLLTKRFFIGPDDGLCGRIAAGFIGKMTQMYNIAIFTAAKPLSSYVQEKRISSFRRVMEDASPGKHTISVVECLSRNGGTNCQIIEDYVRSRLINAVYLPDGAIIDSFSMNPINYEGKRPVIISHELNPETSAMLLADIVDLTINQNPYHQGYESVKRAYNCLENGNSPEYEFVSADLRVVIREML